MHQHVSCQVFYIGVMDDVELGFRPSKPLLREFGIGFRHGNDPSHRFSCSLNRGADSFQTRPWRCYCTYKWKKNPVCHGIFCSFSIKIRHQSPTRRLIPSSHSSKSAHPICSSQESVSSVYRPLLLGKASTGGFVSASFNDSTTTLSFPSIGLKSFGWSFYGFLLRWVARRSKVGTIPPKDIAETQEWANFRLGSRILELRDSFCSVVCRSQEARWSKASQLSDGFGNELALLHFEGDHSVLKEF